ncbi:hypothetical protein DFH09DRAFT_1073211 [Mycena vulgaris]|nr:hypothetical protein DFH09DRAFT_1073211 [Mycena vulgaris]
MPPRILISQPALRPYRTDATRDVMVWTEREFQRFKVGLIPARRSSGMLNECGWILGAPHGYSIAASDGHIDRAAGRRGSGCSLSRSASWYSQRFTGRWPAERYCMQYTYWRGLKKHKKPDPEEMETDERIRNSSTPASSPPIEFPTNPLSIHDSEEGNSHRIAQRILWFPAARPPELTPLRQPRRPAAGLRRADHHPSLGAKDRGDSCGGSLPDTSLRLSHSSTVDGEVPTFFVHMERFSGPRESASDAEGKPAQRTSPPRVCARTEIHGNFMNIFVSEQDKAQPLAAPPRGISVLILNGN